MATTFSPRVSGPGIGAKADPVATEAIAALINDAPVPMPTTLKTFGAMMAREFRVIGRNAVSTIIRSITQPLLFVFVFAYVFPKIGGGIILGRAAGAAAAAHGATHGGINFTTILLPGLMGSMIIMQGMLGTTMPLVMEFSWQRTIEDRALAPVPIRVLGIQKITAGAIRAVMAAPIVLLVTLFVHAADQGPHIHVANWLMLVLVMIGSSTVTAAMGLLLGTMMDPRKTQMTFTVVLMPMTMLGCVYYPWSALHAIRWLQTLVLLNPMVYMSEGLRAALTPSVAHMPAWGVLLALFGGTLVFGYLGLRTFRNRVVN
ncbi:MAG TPA: ABC transporter permease [Streptosporangiaceae bacterium]|nr:ABC transporter permease [Streptosporangiaceae bacterium]